MEHISKIIPGILQRAVLKQDERSDQESERGKCQVICWNSRLNNGGISNDRN